MYVGKNPRQKRWFGDNGSINSIWSRTTFQIITNIIGCEYYYKEKDVSIIKKNYRR